MSSNNPFFFLKSSLNILIIHERHFHFHFVVAARLYANTYLFSHHCMVDLSAALCNVPLTLNPSIQLTKHNSSLSKPHQVRAARFYKSRCSALQPASVRHFWSNYFVITNPYVLVKFELKLIYHFRVY